MQLSDVIKHISDETPAGERWRQTDDGWFNLWRCIRGSSTAYRIEKDGAPMRESTAVKLAQEYCKNCYNTKRCKFYELYR